MAERIVDDLGFARLSGLYSNKIKNPLKGVRTRQLASGKSAGQQ
jgi:hypothetical protein